MSDYDPHGFYCSDLRSFIDIKQDKIFKVIHMHTDRQIDTHIKEKKNSNI